MSGTKKQMVVIRRSCLTGRVVWIYRGANRGAARMAYQRACRKEIQRVRQWCEAAARWRASILRLLNECLADIPITQSLTPEQAASAIALRELSSEDIRCDREFYNHIIEERHRRYHPADVQGKSASAVNASKKYYV